MLYVACKIDFEIDEKTKQGIADATARYRAHINELDINPFLLERFGKKACKKWGISPDSLMQLGFQVAYHRSFSKTVTTYESCSTSAFKHGRTEAIRPATSLTKVIFKLTSIVYYLGHCVVYNTIINNIENNTIIISIGRQLRNFLISAH